MRSFMLVTFFLFGFQLVHSQNVGIGTTIPAAKLHIKGNADSIQLIIDALSLQTKPLVQLRNVSGVELLRLHADTLYNVFMGYAAGTNNNKANGWFNTFIGSNSGFYNTIGKYNSAFGRASLYQNTSGERNTALGFHTLFSNTSGSYNTAIGSEALDLNQTGGYNTAVGFEALKFNISGFSNTAIGRGALYNNNADYNTAVGTASLSSNTTGTSNTAVGYWALLSNSTNGGNTAVGFKSLSENNGASNTAVGAQALQLNSNGHFNSAFGGYTLTSNISGIFNTATGISALQSNTTGNENTANGSMALTSNTTGKENTAIGTYALANNTQGDWNTAVGESALSLNTSGLVNTAVGYNSLSYNQTGSYNTAIGAGAGPGSGFTNLNNIVCIGNIATATASNQIVIGNATNNQLYCYAAYAATTSNAPNLHVFNNGLIARSTSSARYKKDITELEINASDIYRLRPVSYTSINEGTRHFGLIAEEVAEVIPQLAEYAPEKNVIKGSSSEKLIPDAVQYPLLSVLLLAEVQKHESTINAQQKMIDDLKKEVDALKQLIKK